MYMRSPKIQADWLAIAKDFEEMWNLPHVGSQQIQVPCFTIIKGILAYNFFVLVMLVIALS